MAPYLQLLREEHSLYYLYGLGGLKMNDCGEKKLTSYFAVEDDLLGTNSEIGLRLRQFYMKIQEEAIPAHLLELLDKLGRVEQTSLNGVEKV